MKLKSVGDNAVKYGVAPGALLHRTISVKIYLVCYILGILPVGLLVSMQPNNMYQAHSNDTNAEEEIRNVMSYELRS